MPRIKLDKPSLNDRRFKFTLLEKAIHSASNAQHKNIDITYIEKSKVIMLNQ